MKKIGLIITLVLGVLLCCTNVKAEDCAYIKASYSQSIAPASGDTFNITYKIENGSKEASFTIDASTITKGKATLNLPKNNYQITKIEYTGSNELIKKEGYAVASKFSSTENGSTIEIGIGAVKAYEINMSRMNVIYKAPADNNGNTEYYTQKAESSSEFQTQAMSEEYTTLSPSTQQRTNDETPTIKVYKTDNSHSILYRLIPILILAVGGSLAIFIAHKRGLV